MRNYYTPSKKLQKQIDKANALPLVIGQKVSVAIKHFNQHTKSTEMASCTVVEISGDKFGVKSLTHGATLRLPRDQIHIHATCIGANPIPDDGSDRIRSVNFSLESILFNLDILGDKRDDPYIMEGHLVKELNWNPYVFVKGKKQYFQRPFVWELEDKQLLIESIYNSVDCGKILVRKQSFEFLNAAAKQGETELFFNDLIDGKQRLNAVREFILGEFKDQHGNYFADLCWAAKRRVTDNQLMSYSEMPEATSDKHVLSQFLKLNFAGRPQSKEHLDFVRGLYAKAV